MSVSSFEALLAAAKERGEALEAVASDLRSELNR